MRWQLQRMKLTVKSQPSLQASAIQSDHNHLNFGAPQFPGAVCRQLSCLCQPWHDLSLWLHPIVEYSFQSQHLIYVNIVVVRFIMNVSFNGVRFTRYFAQNQNVCENLWSLCYQSWHDECLNQLDYPRIIHHTLPFFLYACVTTLSTKCSPSSINYCNIVVNGFLQMRPRRMHRREVMIVILTYRPLTKTQHPNTINHRENTSVLPADIPHIQIHIALCLIPKSSMHPCNSAVTHKLPTKSIEFCEFPMRHQLWCYVVNINAGTFTHNDYV